MRVCFYGAVFALFATVGTLILLTSTAYISPVQIVLTIIISGGFAIGYAAVSIWQRFWLIPIIGISEGILFSFVGSRFHANRQLIAPGSPVQQQIQALALIGIASTILGYVLFTVFFARQGGRYFRAHNEIAMAAEIHRALVPPIHKKIGSFEIYGISVPSGEVGGDLVDVAENSESWTGYVADVSGHGVSAGLLMAMFKTAVRTRAADLSSGDLLAEVHSALYPLKTPNMFATVGVLQWTGQTFNLALAGHPPLLHYVHSKGEVREYPPLDLPLGVLPEETFRSEQVVCQAGDILLLLTDGLTEVFDRNGNEMGSEPLKKALKKSANEDLAKLSVSIRNVALNFGKQMDDQTMLIIRRSL
ncbi:MAG TPA: SpoIIE family protein phosphatase [Candidatus Acidoferrales bacterium]|nr:SpoIIE family protein phosphatase [Candidatus Acidoferrales bacterium]